MKNLVARPHIIFSVENSPYPEKVKNPISHESALDSLKQIGGGQVVSLDDHYGKPEKSILISNPSDAQLKAARELAHSTGQESHIESDGYSHKMYFNHGPDAGKIVQGRGTEWYSEKPSDFYSTLPSGEHFSHNFDFGKSEARPTAQDLKSRLEKGKGGDWQKEGGYTFVHQPADSKTSAHKVLVYHNQKRYELDTPEAEDHISYRMNKYGESRSAAKKSWLDNNHPEHGGLVGYVTFETKDQPKNSLVFGFPEKAGQAYRTWVDKNHRRKGLASEMYRRFEEATGIKTNPSPSLLEGGEALWSQPNRPFGKSQSLEKGKIGPKCKKKLKAYSKRKGWQYPSAVVHLQAGRICGSKTKSEDSNNDLKKDLRRWVKEKWANPKGETHHGSGKSGWRPTVKVSEKTPDTWGEMSSHEKRKKVENKKKANKRGGGWSTHESGRKQVWNTKKSELKKAPIAYHGSTKAFEEHERPKKDPKATLNYGPGIYYATDPEEASRYAQPQIGRVNEHLETYLEIAKDPEYESYRNKKAQEFGLSNPKDTQHKNWQKFADHMLEYENKKVSEKLGLAPNVRRADVQVKNAFDPYNPEHAVRVYQALNHEPNMFRLKGESEVGANLYHHIANEVPAWQDMRWGERTWHLNRAIKRAGFDGIHDKKLGHIIAFSPKQVKTTFAPEKAPKKLAASELKKGAGFSNWSPLTDNHIQQEYEWEYKNHWDHIGHFPTVEHFREAVRQSPVEEITPEKDRSIHNRSRTNSIEELKDLTSGYQFPRDVDRIVSGFKQNHPIPYPIILKDGDKHTVMSGNTRMDAAFINGINPKAIVIDVNKYGKKRLNKSNSSIEQLRSKLEKGVAQRKFPFNPKAVSTEEREDLNEWQTYGQQPSPSVDYFRDPISLREELPKIQSNAKQRGLLRLGKLTQVRKNPQSGEREFLLHRGILGQEAEDVMGETNQYRYHSRSSWTPHYIIAKPFTSPEGHSFLADEETDLDRPGRVISAWIPESKIAHIPNMYGDVKGVRQGTNMYSPEHEIIVDPHEGEHVYFDPKTSTSPASQRRAKIQQLSNQLKLRTKKSNPLEKGAGGDWKKEKYSLKHTQVTNPMTGSKLTKIVALDSSGNTVGKYHFADDTDLDTIYPVVAETHPEHQRKGIATAAYKLAEKLTQKKLEPSFSQTPEARALWSQKKRPFGKSQDLEKGKNGDWEKEGYTLRHVPFEEEYPRLASSKRASPSSHPHIDHVHAFDKEGNAVASLTYGTIKTSDSLTASIQVDPAHQRKGLATAMYQLAEKISGKKFVRDSYQTEGGKALWSQPNRPFGKSELKKNVGPSIVKINPEHGRKIADAYHEMKHDPNHPEVKAAYNALIGETKKQYQNLLGRGIKVSKMSANQENPYPTSKHLHADMDKGHLWYFPTEHGFGSEQEIPKDHPMLQPTEFKDSEGKPMLANDLFRIVHDSIHHKLKNSFGPNGEHESYLEHKKMYSPLAQKALATETMGQNSYVNFSKQIGHLNQQKPGSAYAPQKAGLLPDSIVGGKWHE